MSELVSYDMQHLLMHLLSECRFFYLMFSCMNNYSHQLFYHTLNCVMYYVIVYDYSIGLEEADLW